MISSVSNQYTAAIYQNTINRNKQASNSSQNQFNHNQDIESQIAKDNPSEPCIANSYEIAQTTSRMNNQLTIYVSKPIYEDENYIVYGPAYNPQGILSDKVLVNNKKDGSVIFFEDLKNPTQFTESLLSYINENKLSFAQLEKHVIENKFNSPQTDNLFFDFVKSVDEVQIKRKEYTVVVDNYN